MTSERRKSILILIATLVIGVLLGLLVPGLIHKLGNRTARQFHGRTDGNEHRRMWFAGTIRRIVQPDSAQANQIRPITDWASVRIDSIESTANSQMSELLDSVKMQLKPILRDDQWKRLEDFDTRAKSNWGRGGGRGHRGRN